MTEPPAGPGDRPPAGTSPRTSTDAARAGRAAAMVGVRGDRAGSRAAGVLYGSLAATVLGLVLFVAAALLAFSASLVVLALFGGRIVGLSVRSGTLRTETTLARVCVAIALTLAALTLALVATWAFARLTGGVLDLPAYLFETLGAVVPVSYALGALGAWWGAG